MLTYVEEEWLNIESMLTQERGIWGPYNETILTKWMLDLTEVCLLIRDRHTVSTGCRTSAF